MASSQGRGTATVALVLLGVLATFACAHANNITVGGSTGWTLKFNYTEWAKNQTFLEGDTLIFNYKPGVHTVLSVKKDAYWSCNKTSPLKQLTAGNDAVTLKSGWHYYICGVGNHCSLGMKFAINVESVGPSPSPVAGGPTTGGNTGPSQGPSPSDAPALVSSSIAMILGALAVVVASFLV